jgi:hypothetical protein
VLPAAAASSITVSAVYTCFSCCCSCIAWRLNLHRVVLLALLHLLSLLAAVRGMNNLFRNYLLSSEKEITAVL